MNTTVKSRKTLKRLPVVAQKPASSIKDLVPDGVKQALSVDKPKAPKASSLISIGSDPELCVLNVKENRIVSAIGLFPLNNKERPIDLGDGIKMYPDNVLLEASFPPATSREQFVGVLRKVLMRMQGKIGPKFRLLPQASHVYDKDQLNCEQAWAIGCHPSFNAHTHMVNAPSDFTSGLRTGSFHIHVGHDSITESDGQIAIIKLMDVFVGCASIIVDKDPSSLARRDLYGKAGEHRPCSYGAEYRVCAPGLLRSPDLVSLAYGLTLHAMSHITDGTAKDLIASLDMDNVQAAINGNNPVLAETILTNAGLPKALMNRVKFNYGTPDLYKTWELSI